MSVLRTFGADAGHGPVELMTISSTFAFNSWDILFAELFIRAIKNGAKEQKRIVSVVTLKENKIKFV